MQKPKKIQNQFSQWSESRQIKKIKRRSPNSIIGWMWVGFGLFVAAIFVFFVLVYNGVIGYMPPIEELRNPHDRFASTIYSANGEEMGRFFRGSGNRINADFDEISPYVIDALIATEDSRFNEHSGIDGRALIRVLGKTILMQNKSAGGGSTLTQQLAKQLYSEPSSNIFTRALQKPIEWMIAVKLERYYSKDEIIKWYLNQFDFLYNGVGIRSAAWVYFGKEPMDLNIQEAATLVGMAKNPSYYNPKTQPERATERRNTVFEQMEKAGMLTRAEVDSLSALPLVLDFHKIDHKEGPAPYFREELRRIMRAKKPEPEDYRSWERGKFLDDSTQWENNPLYGWVEKNPKPDGTKYDIYTDGLKIYTTIDTRMQDHAEAAVLEHMKSLQRQFNAQNRGNKLAPYTRNRQEISEIRINHLINMAMKQTDRYRAMKQAGKSRDEIDRAFHTPVPMKVFSYSGVVDTTMTPMDSLLYQKQFLRTGFMVMDPKNGHIKAYVGGPDFTYFTYDMVSTGRRQIGSTVKPYLYAYAMEEGFTPCSVLPNSPPVITTDDKGSKWIPRNGRGGGGMIDLKSALTASNNWISARLIQQLGPTSLVRQMHNFGITGDLPAVMSLCLGPCDVSVKEMVTGYTAFANNGMKVDPIYVTRIEDSNGNVISEFTPKYTEVMSEGAYYRMLSMLINVVNHGTAHRLKGTYSLDGDIGGKTGTSNYNADGWFMGFTPQLVAGAWVGGEERYIHFNTGAGSTFAMPIWGSFFKRLYADSRLPYRNGATFEFPSSIDLCAREYVGAGDGEPVYSGGGGGEAEPEVEETSNEEIFD